MSTLLAELDLVCDRCDALSPPRTSACPRCHVPFEDAAPSPFLARLDSYAGEEAELVILRGQSEQGRILRIPPEGATIGRTEGDVRLLGDETLAPLAARFAYQGGRLFVRDEAGGTGVFVSIGEQVVLEPGHSFALGDHLLRHGGLLLRRPGADIQGAPFPGKGPLLRLETLLLGGGVGRVHLLPFPIRIGRRQGEVLLRDRFVSGRHCALYWDGERVVLEDLGSTNGTFLRLPPRQWHPLRRGDTLRLGRNILQLR